jgi:hypothetical protein
VLWIIWLYLCFGKVTLAMLVTSLNRWITATEEDDGGIINKRWSRNRKNQRDSEVFKKKRMIRGDRRSQEWALPLAALPGWESRLHYQECWRRISLGMKGERLWTQFGACCLWRAFMTSNKRSNGENWICKSKGRFWEVIILCHLRRLVTGSIGLERSLRKDLEWEKMEI